MHTGGGEVIKELEFPIGKSSSAYFFPLTEMQSSIPAKGPGRLQNLLESTTSNLQQESPKRSVPGYTGL